MGRLRTTIVNNGFSYERTRNQIHVAVILSFALNILLISTNRNALPTPVFPYGACQIAEAAERAGHQVTLLDLMFERNAIRAVEKVLKRCRYDAIGLSVRNIDNNSMQKPVNYIVDLASLVRRIRAGTDAPVILGGAALSIMPQEILRATGATCAVRGSGTAVFPRLLDRLNSGQPLDDLPGVIIQERGEGAKVAADPATFSGGNTTDYSRWIDVNAYQSRLATVPIQTKTGCGFTCVYCTYPTIEGEGRLLHDPKVVANSIQKLAARGFRDFEFVDSVFNAPPGHALALCDALAKKRLFARFQSMDVNPLFLDDDLLSSMERAGFTGMGMTVESASDPVLSGLRKGFTAAHVYKAAETVRRHSVPCLWIFMFGGPGETEDTVQETLRFAEKEIRPADAAFFTIGIRIYPGTGLETIARKQGVLSLSPAEMLAPVFYTSPGVDPWRMEQQVRNSIQRHMNFLCADSLSFPHLPALHQLGRRLGLTTPLWRHTRHIRRGLRFFGMDG
jgi:radical SAM superfamily enzyme YgiQ (UPF0313 family)